MKIQIDTQIKTIKIQGIVNLNELFEIVKEMFPDEKWKEYSLESTNEMTNWINPVIIRESSPYTIPIINKDWRGYPKITYLSGTKVIEDPTFTTGSPLVNFEIN